MIHAKIILLAYLIIVLLTTICATPCALSKRVWKKNILKSRNEIEKSCTNSKDVKLMIDITITSILLCNLFSIIMFVIIGCMIATKIAIILTSLKAVFIFINSWTSIADLYNVLEKRIDEIKFPRFYLLFNLILKYSVCLYGIYMLLK